jgi:hypothetical protein
VIRAAARGFALALACATPGLAETRDHALLVGVSGYPHLAPRDRLEAPRTDVVLMREALLARGVPADAMTLLADGVEGSAADPTRAAILAALGDLARAAKPGDRVIVYLSGHGSRQPDADGDEADGADEVFMPLDVVPPAAGSKVFGGAIVDDEMDAALGAIRRSGAALFYIADSCFSGGNARAAPGMFGEKAVDIADYGVAMGEAPRPDAASDAASDRPGDGAFVAFYASQPNETARYAALPISAPAERRVPVSLFTKALAEAIRDGRGLSHRALMEETARLLRIDPAIDVDQTPSFEGGGLDRVAFGGDAPAALRWRVSGNTLSAGLLSGVEPGARVTLHAGAGEEAAIGEAVVLAAKPFSATLDAAVAGAAYARLAQPAPARPLRIAAPRPWQGAAPDARTEALAAAFAGLLASVPDLATPVEATPDLVPLVDAAGIRLSPANVDPARTEVGPEIAAETLLGDPAMAEGALTRALLRLRQMERLRGVGAAARASVLAPIRTRLAVRRFRADVPPRRWLCGAGVDPALYETKPDGAPIEAGDTVCLAVENRDRVARFVMAFVFSDALRLSGASPACPRGPSINDRLEPGRIRDDIVLARYPPGAVTPGRRPEAQNGALVVSVPFAKGDLGPPNLCGLTRFNDDGATRSAGAAQEGADDPFAPRGARGALLKPDATVEIRTWPVLQGVR